MDSKRSSGQKHHKAMISAKSKQVHAGNRYIVQMNYTLGTDTQGLHNQARLARASPWPWKKRKDRAKSNTNMRTNEITTALVVDSPTPLAPPVVV